MSFQEILEEVARIAREKIEWQGPLSAEMRLLEDLEMDFIRLLTLAMAVENHFRIRLSEEDEESIETVGDLVLVIEREIRAAS